MDRERSYALIIRAGAPQHLEYRGLRKQPFWRLREGIMLHLTEERLGLQWRLGVLAMRSGAQGYPGEDANIKVAEQLEMEALKAARQVGQALMPWIEWPEIETAEQRATRELYGESDGLLEAWIRRFEPENLERFREARDQRIAQRAQTHG